MGGSGKAELLMNETFSACISQTDKLEDFVRFEEMSSDEEFRQYRCSHRENELFYVLCHWRRPDSCLSLKIEVKHLLCISIESCTR